MLVCLNKAKKKKLICLSKAKKAYCLKIVWKNSLTKAKEANFHNQY